MFHVPIFCYSLCIATRVFHFSLTLMFLCALLLPYFVILPCFIAICFNVLCFTSSPCFITPMLHCSKFCCSMFQYSHASLFHHASLFLSCFTTLVFHYSHASLPLPCFATLVICHSHVLLFFIISLFMCDIVFVLHTPHVLLLVTLLLPCDVTFMFCYSCASSLFRALNTFLFLVLHCAPVFRHYCASLLICFATHCVLLFPFPYRHYSPLFF